MRSLRAQAKLCKAIDALIDLQCDYAREVKAAGIAYQLQIALDSLNEMSIKIEQIED